jgi:hypothetical protein
MKILSLVVTIGGIIVLFLAIIEVLANIRIMGVTGAGFLRGAMSLFLLALVIMVYDKFYLQKK